MNRALLTVKARKTQERNPVVFIVKKPQIDLGMHRVSCIPLSHIHSYYFLPRIPSPPPFPFQPTCITHCKDKMPKNWNKYSQKRNIGVSVPVSTFMCLWANYIQGGSDKSGILIKFFLNDTAQLKTIRFHWNKNRLAKERTENQFSQ